MRIVYQLILGHTARNQIGKHTVSRVYVRHLNQEIHPSSPRYVNPLKKKGSSFPRDTNIASRMCLTIIGNAAVGQPRCVALFTDIKGFIFNCGEGVGRLCREYEVNFILMRHFFITQRNWQNLSGLPDVYLTNEVYGLPRMTLYGPPGVELFPSLLSSFRNCTKLCQASSYSDENLEIGYIPVKRSNLAVHSSHHSKTNGINAYADVTYNYVCNIHKRLGDFNPEKCVDQGVPFGPHLLKLKNGEDVVLPSGRVIYSTDVLDAVQRRIIFLVVDCPSEDFLDSFVYESQFIEYQLPADSASDVTAVFHYSPPHIIKSKKYQDWMQKFHQNTKHYILNSTNSSASSSAVHQSQSILHLLHPEIFKLLPEKEKSDREYLSPTSNIIHPPPMLQLHIRPEEKFNWCNVVNCNFDEYIQMIKEVPDFNYELKKLESLIPSLSKAEKKYPEVLFLGTSSATSTAFRNVSAILVHLNSNESILLDCGEGTVMQLTRYFGISEVDSVLQKISCVFISHMHTDHYLGLFTFVKARMEAFENSGAHYQKLNLIMPRMINQIFTRFCDIFEPLRSKVRIISCSALTSENRNPDKFNDLLQVQLETVPVRHCIDAYGIVLQDSNWKIVYSGDTAPCQKLIDAGENCTLLIHEASVEDDLLNEATMKKHSTPSQVVEIAEKMNAKFTILTHFSKRYLAVPVFPEHNQRPVGCAFDFMKVRLNDLPLLPHFLSSLKCLFQEQIDSHVEKSSAVASFENVFLKTCRAFKTNFNVQAKNS